MDDDEWDAYNLSGSWEGDFGMTYNGYRASDTQIEFIPDHNYSTYGTGYQRDYYPAYGAYMTFDIEWSVQNGTLYIYYYDDQGQIPDLDTEIHSYGLNDSYFWGYVGGTYFRMNKIEDFYDRYGSSYYAKSMKKSAGKKVSGTIENYDRTKVRNIYMK
jgi:hypothetical protein